MVGLAKFPNAGRKNNQLRTVRHRHSRALHRLVAQPRAVKFMRIEINHRLSNRRVQDLEIHFQA